MKYLFLDDVREPRDAFEYTQQDMFKTETWDVVRNYQEFVGKIEKYGLPDIISFDHDLADEHHVPSEYWNSWEASENYQKQRENDYKEKTGYDCAKWLVEYCLDNECQLPATYCHSMNPIGKAKIESLLRQFAKTQQL